jgi:hypothetical protein
MVSPLCHHARNFEGLSVSPGPLEVYLGCPRGRSPGHCITSVGVGLDRSSGRVVVRSYSRRLRDSSGSL